MRTPRTNAHKQKKTFNFFLTLSSILGGKIRSSGPPMRFILMRTWFLSTERPSIIKSLGGKIF